jgi:hypothetical protein
MRWALRRGVEENQFGGVGRVEVGSEDALSSKEKTTVTLKCAPNISSHVGLLSEIVRLFVLWSLRVGARLFGLGGALHGVEGGFGLQQNCT